MKKTIFTQRSRQGWHPVVRSISLGCILILSTAISFIGCNKQTSEEQALNPSKQTAKISAQPLPGGKRNFSVTMGNFDNNGYTWVRIINWTFNETAGTVGGTSWTWRSDVKAGKSVFNSHYCTLDGASSTCNTYSPTGWSSGPSIHQSWSGTYTYNTSTGLLVIDWNTISGAATTATDSWTVTLPQTGLARVVLNSSNYTLTHGRGYGSNAAWTTYKTISNIVNAGMPSYTSTTGRNVRAAGSSSAGTVTIYPTQTSTGLWGGAAFSLAGTTTPSSPTPATTLHRYNPDATGCGVPSACATSKPGSVIHFATTSNRQVAYNIWCACLAQTSSWPCYTGNMHPFAFMQIIDDTGTLKGFIGVETQNPPESSYNGAFQFQCVDFTSVP